jgi:hypothetical protein
MTVHDDGGGRRPSPQFAKRTEMTKRTVSAVAPAVRTTAPTWGVTRKFTCREDREARRSVRVAAASGRRGGEGKVLEKQRLGCHGCNNSCLDEGVTGVDEGSSRDLKESVSLYFGHFRFHSRWCHITVKTRQD